MIRNWGGMRALASRLLLESTGEDLDGWNHRVEREGPSDEKILRIWLSQRGVTGFTQSYLVVERFGYPDDLAVIGEELIDGQYNDRPALRAVFDRLVKAATANDNVSVQPRKTHVSLFSPLRMFARLESPAPDRIDLHLRLEAIPAGSRLQPSTAFENLPARISLESIEDVDDEVLEWLQQAYAENT